MGSSILEFNVNKQNEVLQTSFLRLETRGALSGVKSKETANLSCSFCAKSEQAINERGVFVPQNTCAGKEMFTSSLSFKDSSIKFRL